jgi:starch synthase
MRILFVASEAVPFAKTGGLADVIDGLPRALVEQGQEVAVVLPRYRGVKATATVVPSLTIPLGPQLRFPAIVGGELHRGVRYFFVDDPQYFDRAQIYGEGGDYPDNAERFSELCRAAIELAKQVWTPDIFHCNDWQTGLLPVLLRTQCGDDPRVKDSPVVFTIHNVAYQGIFARDVLGRLGIPASLFDAGGIEFFGSVNLLKGGLVYSDYLTTVSPRYAQEIQTPEYGHGLDGVIRDRAGRLRGILNGVDYSVWSPENDTRIAANYSRENLAGKKACKQELLKICGLPAENERRAVVGIVSRFADQKGLDLIVERAHELMNEQISLVALGTGERRYEELFRALAQHSPGRAAAKIAYDETLAHKIEAGADIFLMPSRYEPCGLNQIYSLRYGTVPVVRATGGLDDTIEEFDPERGTGTGFKFADYSGKAMLDCVRRALHYYRDEAAWALLQRNGMAKDFSWKASAAEYAKLYATAKAGRNQMPVATSN